MTDGRIHPHEPLYCEGGHKPTCRGWFHLLSTLAIPLLLPPAAWRARADIAAFGASAMLCYGCSAAYHMVAWPTHAMEIWVQKCDHVAILILAAGSYLPLARRLPRGEAAWLVASSWTAVMTGAYFILHRGIGSAIPKVVATATILPILPALARTLPARSMAHILSTLGLYGVGLWMYQTKRPTLLPHHFGYHELFHLIISFGGYLTIQLHTDRTM